MTQIIIGILLVIGMLIFVVYQNINHPGASKPVQLKNGDWIKITYLPPCKNGQGSVNPYIGMEGEVWDFDGHTFSLQCETNWLACIDIKTCKYQFLFK